MKIFFFLTALLYSYHALSFQIDLMHAAPAGQWLVETDGQKLLQGKDFLVDPQRKRVEIVNQKYLNCHLPVSIHKARSSPPLLEGLTPTLDRRFEFPSGSFKIIRNIGHWTYVYDVAGRLLYNKFISRTGFQLLEPREIARVNVLKGPPAIMKYGKPQVMEIYLKNVINQLNVDGLYSGSRSIAGDPKSSSVSEGLDLGQEKANSIPEGTSFHLRLFPNPATDRLRVQLEGFAEKAIKYDIVEITGKVVLPSRQIEGEGQVDQEIDISQLRNGHYYLRIKSADRWYRRSFQIVR